MTKTETKSVVVTDIEKIKEFQRILKVLQNYYALSDNKKSATSLNRDAIINADPSNVYLEITRLPKTKYDYKVKGYDKKSEYTEDSIEWIHIDGIAQERENFLENGIDNHPVFNIVCLSDLIV